MTVPSIEDMHEIYVLYGRRLCWSWYRDYPDVANVKGEALRTGVEIALVNQDDNEIVAVPDYNKGDTL